MLCSEEADIGGKMYKYTPSTRTTSHVGNLNDACHEAERRSDGRPSTGDGDDVDGNDVKEGKGGSPMRMCVAQGKSHVPFVEGSDGRLYFGSHVGESGESRRRRC